MKITEKEATEDISKDKTGTSKGADTEIRKEMMSLFSLSVKVLIPTFPLLNVSLFYFSAVGKLRAFRHLF